MAMTVGVAICIFALNFFLLPEKIAPGGFSGIASILYYTLHWPVGLVVLALNIPCFLLAFRQLGKTFALRTLYALVLYSVLADVIPVFSLAEDTFLACVAGGVLMGAGLGITIYFGGSTGGSDLVAVLIHHHYKFISVGLCIFVIDFAVIVASGIVFDVRSALFALVALYLTTKLIELVTEGLGRAKAFIIISPKYKEIESAIMAQMQRGVTEFFGAGGYSGEKQTILLCMVERGREVVKLKTLVESIDDQAFLVHWEAKEVNGEGFSFMRREESP